MVKISDLEPGMKIKIVDRWPSAFPSPYLDGMDHWLGKIATVRSVRKPMYVRIVEDEAEGPSGDGYYWGPQIIDRIVTEDELLPDTEFDGAPDDIFQSLFFPSPRKEVSHG